MEEMFFFIFQTFSHDPNKFASPITGGHSLVQHITLRIIMNFNIGTLVFSQFLLFPCQQPSRLSLQSFIDNVQYTMFVQEDISYIFKKFAWIPQGQRFDWREVGVICSDVYAVILCNIKMPVSPICHTVLCVQCFFHLPSPLLFSLFIPPILISSPPPLFHCSFFYSIFSLFLFPRQSPPRLSSSL